MSQEQQTVILQKLFDRPAISDPSGAAKCAFSSRLFIAPTRHYFKALWSLGLHPLAGHSQEMQQSEQARANQQVRQILEARPDAFTLPTALARRVAECDPSDLASMIDEMTQQHVGILTAMSEDERLGWELTQESDYLEKFWKRYNDYWAGMEKPVIEWTTAEGFIQERASYAKTVRISVCCLPDEDVDMAMTLGDRELVISTPFTAQLGGRDVFEVEPALLWSKSTRTWRLGCMTDSSRQWESLEHMAARVEQFWAALTESEGYTALAQEMEGFDPGRELYTQGSALLQTLHGVVIGVTERLKRESEEVNGDGE